VGRDGTRVTHPRLRFGGRSIDYRHYLPELARKPQAVRQVLPDLLRNLGAPFPLVWTRLHDTYGPREAARRFAKILGTLATHGTPIVIPALLRALATGAPLTLAGLASPPESTVNVPAALGAIEVTSGCAADYDTWLTGVSA